MQDDDTSPDLVRLDGLDPALLGIGSQGGSREFFVYSAAKILECLCTEQGMDQEEALEWFSNNIESMWAGETTPIILWDVAFTLIDGDI